MIAAAHTDEVTLAAYWGNLLLNTETGRYHILANRYCHDNEALKRGDLVGKGCPCGNLMRYGAAVTDWQAEEINDRIAAGELKVDDNSAVPQLPYVRGVGVDPMSTVAQALEAPDGQIVAVTGLLYPLTFNITKQGRTWAYGTLRDSTAEVEALVFPSPYEDVHKLLTVGAALTVSGRMDRRDDKPRLMLQSVNFASREDVQ